MFVYGRGWDYNHGVYVYICHFTCFSFNNLTSESPVIGTQLHLLIMFGEHLDNHLNSITEGGGGRRSGGRSQKLLIISKHLQCTCISDKLTCA